MPSRNIFSNLACNWVGWEDERRGGGSVADQIPFYRSSPNDQILFWESFVALYASPNKPSEKDSPTTKLF